MCFSVSIAVTIHMEKLKFDFYCSPYIKSSLRWFISLNVKGGTLNNLENKDFQERSLIQEMGKIED